MKYLISCVCIALLILFSAALRAQVKIQITHIGASSLEEAEIWVTEKEDIAGTVTLDEAAPEQDLLLKLAWRRSGEDTWWMHPQSFPVQSISGTTATWKFEAVSLGSDFDYKKNLQIVAFAVTPAEPLPEDIVDYPTLRYLSTAISNRIKVYRTPKIQTSLYVTPRIRIAAIAGQRVRSDQIHEVGLKALISGEVRKPTASMIRLVVQPLGEETFWVMEDEPLLREGRWHSKIDFTVHGFDLETDFMVLAVIVREDLPRGRGLSLPEWRSYLQTHISALSTLVRVKRVEIPLAKNQIAIKILSVDGVPLLGGERPEVQPRCTIRGMLLGRTLAGNESIWLLSSPEFGDSAWQVLGRAGLTNERYWELPPRLIGGNGEYLKLMAVVSRGQRQAAGSGISGSELAYSAPVHVRTQDQPPLQVKINRIAQKPVDARGELQTYRVGGIEGMVAGRPLENGDKVWILKMAGQQWQLLGQAGFTTKHQWTLPPVTLGESGEELLLVAVVSKTRIENLSTAAQSHILAYSEGVHVKLLE